MSKVFLRRGRFLPGPLKVLQQAERRSPVPMASLALTSAAMAAALLLMPQLASRASVDPQPLAEFAGAGPTRPETRTSAAPLLIAATPAAAEPVVTPPPAQVAIAAPAPSRPASPKQAAGSVKPVVDQSLFELDLLPVLQAGGVDLDTGAAMPPKAVSKASARRTAARAAVVATDGSTQP